MLAKIVESQRTDNHPKKRLAILGDIERFSLPPLKVKDKDPMVKAFRINHGFDVIKADALPPVELRKRIKEAVEGLIDKVPWGP